MFFILYIYHLSLFIRPYTYYSSILIMFLHILIHSSIHLGRRPGRDARGQRRSGPYEGTQTHNLQTIFFTYLQSFKK